MNIACYDKVNVLKKSIQRKCSIDLMPEVLNDNNESVTTKAHLRYFCQLEAKIRLPATLKVMKRSNLVMQ